MIPASSFLLDGDTALLVSPPPWSYMALDRPCDCTLGRSGTMPDCDGTGRHTFDIVVAGAWGDPPTPHEVHRVHVIDVLPIVRGACPTPTNAEHRPAHVHLAEPSDDDQTQSGICKENCDLVWDNPWKSHNLVTLPPDAAPGMWLVRLAIHP